MKDPTEIWLQPWCDECEKHGGQDGRLWCQDDVWTKCEECPEKSVRYILAPARAAIEAMAPKRRKPRAQAGK